ncbi:hypothetical protein Tco_0741019 [Tanacetum coccineum]
MVAVNNVPQLVDIKGDSYAAIAPKQEPKKFNKWKKRMLCFLAGMDPYYIKCIKGGPFQPKTVEGDDKPKSQWTLDERRVVVQDQRLKSIIMSCIPDDIIESAISCETAKATLPNGDALRKFILEGPYTPSTVTIPTVPATDDSPKVPEQTVIETILNMYPENKENYQSENEAIHLLLSGKLEMKFTQLLMLARQLMTCG